MKNTIWDKVGIVKRSKNRKKALELLHDTMMPSELGKKMEISLTHASKIVRELSTEKLIKCLNEKQKVGRIYQITELGEQVLKKT